MIKITRPGQKEFHGFCKWCGCEFTYEISDLKLSATSDKVSCPTCGKDYHHPSMVQDPTIPRGIGPKLWGDRLTPAIIPTDISSTDPCADCVWRENLLRDGIYVGDTPCTWCNKGRFNSSTSILNDCTNQLTTKAPEAHYTLCSSTSSCSSNCATHSCSDDVVNGEVMKTILDCCSSNTSRCGDTEGRNSCSGDHKCNNKKNCKGKH